MIDFCERWGKLVGKEVLNILFEASLVPRILAAVDSWNPLSDSIPIHLWLHPWLPVLGLQAMQPAVRVVADKIANALKDWTPADESARLVLGPWKRVMDEKMWSSLMRRCIVPKLTYAIRGLQINPANQDIEPMKQLFAWVELVDTIDVIQIMKDFFFPKWLDVLDKWIAKGPNRKEVYVWYTGWKEFIPQAVSTDPSIQKFFSEALNLIQRLIK